MIGLTTRQVFKVHAKLFRVLDENLDQLEFGADSPTMISLPSIGLSG
jgi:hypothetical protein